MTIEVKNQSFEDLLNQSLKNTDTSLFDIKQEMEGVALGGFQCYACTRVYSMHELGRTIGTRQYCIKCYQVIKNEPRTKDRGDD